MSATTEISWTDATWNMWPGCLPSSPACANCWARYPGWRMAYNPNQKVSAPYKGIIKKVLGDGTEIIGGEDHERRAEKGTLKFTGLTRFIPERLEQPLRWRAPKRIFVCSNSDLFLPSRVDTEGGRRQIAAVFGVMAACPQHIFQVLTKWPAKAREWFAWAATQRDDEERGTNLVCAHAGSSVFCRDVAVELIDNQGLKREPNWPLPNVHFGVTVEDQPRANERIPELLQVPAAVRWLSVEPMLGPISFAPMVSGDGLYTHTDPLTGAGSGWDVELALSATDFEYGRRGEFVSLDWIVLGGESGSGARPMHPDWARSIRDQCVAAGVPLHFKQWGAWVEVDREVANDKPGKPGALQWTHMVVADGRAFAKAEEIPMSVVTSAAFMRRVGKKAAGRVLDGRTWDEFPRGPK